MKMLFLVFFNIFINIRIFCCTTLFGCYNMNFKDNEFCFLPGNLDTAKVITFMKNTTEIISKIESSTGFKLEKVDKMVNIKSKSKIKNKPKEVAVKNFIAFCEILFILSRSYHLLQFLDKKITEKEEKEEYNCKKIEYLNFLDEAISKTLTRKINKNEKTTNVNDLLKQVMKKCSDCFSTILYCYVYKIDGNTINEYNKNDEEFLDCLVSYIPETDKLIYN